MVRLPDPQPTIGDGTIELAPFDERAAPVLVAWDRDPEMARWFDWSLVRVPDEEHLEHARRVIRDWEDDYRAGRRASFLVREAGSRTPMGSAELRFDDPSRANLSYSTIAEHRRRGIATRAVRLLAGWGLDLGVPEIRLMADAANVASIAVARSAGFALDTVLPGGIAYEGYEPWVGQRHDAEVWVLRPAAP
jgi:RimJ/RimL family protein N-acetyltransferase